MIHCLRFLGAKANVSIASFTFSWVSPLNCFNCLWSPLLSNEIILRSDLIRRTIFSYFYFQHFEDLDDEKTTIADAENSCDHISSQDVIKERSKPELEDSEIVEFKVVWNKQNFHISFDLEKKMADLKEQIRELTGMIF